MVLGDFGPSLSTFPTPVSVLIWRALPWTAGLLMFSTVLAWCLGNLLGGLKDIEAAGCRLAGVMAMGFHPIYYIVAFVLLIVFGYLWPVLPISGGVPQMNLPRGFDVRFIGSVLLHAILPALSLVLVEIGSWFMGMRSLVSNIVTEDYVAAELGGVDRQRILRSYVMRNALVPQVTGLAISLGGIFNGAIITEQVFGYPGIGTLLVDAVHAGDYSLVTGVATVSIVAVAVSVLLVDLAYPWLDPRVKAR